MAAQAMTSLFIPFLALVRKDLLLYFGNRRALVMGIVAPIAIAAFFGTLFDTRQPAGQLGVAITDQDMSPLSQRIVAALQADSGLKLSAMDAAAALAAVTQGKLPAAIVLPKGFGAAAPAALFGVAAKPVITIHHDPSQGAALALVRGLLSQHVMEAVSQAAFGSTGPGLDARLTAQLRDAVNTSPSLPATQQHALQDLFDSLARVQQGAASMAQMPASAAAGRQGGGLSLPFSTETRAATARIGQNYNSFAHSFAGMSVQFILFAGIELGTGVLLARRMGLWTRLRAAPISRSTLLGSRIASGALIALALLAAIYTAAFAFFGVRIQGSVLGFIGIALAFALLTASFGLLIAALGRTPEASRGLAVFATLLLVMLGGAWVPSFIFPPWLQTASLFVPTRWVIDGLDLMTWRGGDLQAALAPIGVTLGFALLFGAVGVWRFPTELDGGPGG